MSLDPDTILPDTDTYAPDKMIDIEHDELLDSCLRHCMKKLPANKRQMILKYYRGDKNVKIKLRKAMAESMGVKLTNLRLKAQRVRVDLKKCILDCMERRSTDMAFARSLAARDPFTSESGEE